MRLCFEHKPKHGLICANPLQRSGSGGHDVARASLISRERALLVLTIPVNMAAQLNNACLRPDLVQHIEVFDRCLGRGRYRWHDCTHCYQPLFGIDVRFVNPEPLKRCEPQALSRCLVVKIRWYRSQWCLRRNSLHLCFKTRSGS